ncbi:serine-threonine protein kinase, putative [Entamoeba invadens IP1]|uniref:Serine-threonine protein kinase, putative n=1 Tax=Entamoeba invadens IP1 TaxID=370355 RepID=A0A0A1U255_ENTIV|nr:serine-threonine protein kinase, putative [Entamoeba invadens IP1]ELP88151.1 serine-threonine protein kinase, putative [Entamoeba invadens IP1]|eukprot:XP_004254922.1 serine-threonine protein kinase, putative [Entamoeba invadens IP1]
MVGTMSMLLTFLSFFVVLCLSADLPGSICYQSDTNNATLFYKALVPSTCVVPQNVEFKWSGSSVIGADYTFKSGAATSIGKHSLTISQNCRGDVAGDKANENSVSKNSLIFEDGHGMDYFVLNEQGIRAFWYVENKHLDGVVFEFMTRSDVWASSVVLINSDKPLYVYTQGYEFFNVTRLNPEAFVLFKVINEDFINNAGITHPFVRTERINAKDQTCVYQYNAFNFSAPDVKNTDFKMISICNRGSIDRYVQCFWSKGKYTDCSCKPKVQEGTIRTTGSFNYPDCRYLSRLYDFNLYTNNEYVIFDSYNTTTWADFLIPQRMNSLTFEVDVTDVPNVTFLSILSSFLLPNFPFTVYGGLNVTEELTIDSVADYYIERLVFNTISVDKYIDDGAIVIATNLINDTNRELMEGQNLYPVCGEKGQIQRWMKLDTLTKPVDYNAIRDCSCTVKSDTLLDQFDCNETSLIETSQLELIIEKSVFDGGNFNRFWAKMEFKGNGGRTLRGLSHTVQNCIFLSDKTYTIATNLTCKNAEIQDRVNLIIEESHAFVAETITLTSIYKNLNGKPVFYAHNKILESTQVLLADSQNECLELVENGEDYGSGTIESDTSTLVKINQLLRVCPTSKVEKSVLCTATKPSYPSGFDYLYCPCKGELCTVAIPSDLTSLVSSEITSFDGTINVSGDVLIYNFSRIRNVTALPSSVSTVTVDGTSLTIDNVEASDSVTTLIAKTPLVLKNVHSLVSLKTLSTITLDYSNVLLDKVTETGTGVITLSSSVSTITVNSIEPISTQATKPIFVVQPTTAELTLGNTPTSTYVKMVMTNKYRKVVYGNITCDNQAVVIPATAGGVISVEDCNKLGLSTHNCYYNGNVYDISSSDSSRDYSCPCIDSNVCVLTISSATISLEVPATKELYVESSPKLIMNSLSLIMYSSCSECAVVIQGNNNFIILSAVEGFQIKSESTTTEKGNVIATKTRAIAFDAGGLKTGSTLKGSQLVAKVVASDKAYCTTMRFKEAATCMICGDIIANSNGKCDNRAAVVNCATTASSGHCTSCADGFYLVGTTLNNQRCEACGNLCTKCSSNTECILCNAGSKLSGTTCTRITEADSCDYYSGGICRKCPGKKMTDGTFQSCTESCSASCDTCYTLSTEEKCPVCTISDKYTREDEAKQSCSQSVGASSVSNKGAMSCENGYSIGSGKCSTCEASCAKCSGVTCYECKNSSQILLNGICTNTNCKTVSNFKCLNCAEESGSTKMYYDDADGQCKPVDDSCNGATFFGVCMKCVNQQDVVSTDKKTCEAPKTTALIKRETSDICELYLFGICQRCSSQYYSSGNECRKCIDNCNLCSDGSSCSLCDDKYTYNFQSKTCEPLTLEHCDNIYKSVCIHCEYGYYAFNGRCQQCNTKCATCVSSTTCSSCAEGYYLNGTSCLDSEEASINFCATYSPEGCLNCTSGYYLDAGNCHTCNEFLVGCMSCNKTSKKCTSCGKDYVMTLDGCVKYDTIEHCKRAIDGYCDECDDWYALSYNRQRCEKYPLGYGVALIIIAIAIFIALLIVLCIMLYVYYQYRSKQLEETRASRVFPLKHCDVALMPYPTMEQIVSEATLIEFQEKMELNKEYMKRFYIGNKGSDEVELQFVIDKDERYRVDFEPHSCLLKSGMCISERVLIYPNCSFTIQNAFKVRVFVDNQLKEELSFKLSANTVDSLFIDPHLINIETNMRSNYKITVSKANYNNQSVVVRNIRSFDFKSDEKKIYDEPLNILENFPQSSYLTKLIGKVLLDKTHLIVTEFATFGTLQDFISAGKEMALSMRCRVLLDAAKGIAVLHAKNFLHYNIKPANVMLMSTDVNDVSIVKLTDFGYQDTYMKFWNHRTEVKERPTYIAPEIITGQKYTSKTDVYAFAVTMYAIATMKEPFPVSEYKYPWSISKFVCVGRRLEQPANMSKQLYNIISNSWEHCSADRFTIDEVVHDLKKVQENSY